MLSDYGEHSEVWIHTYHSYHGNNDGFQHAYEDSHPHQPCHAHTSARLQLLERGHP
jgi:hypothetical protein